MCLREKAPKRSLLTDLLLVTVAVLIFLTQQTGLLPENNVAFPDASSVVVDVAYTNLRESLNKSVFGILRAISAIKATNP